MRSYDREALALAYVDALSREVPGLDGERAGYASALFRHRSELVSGLQRLFGLDIDNLFRATEPLQILFQDVAHSYAAIVGPDDALIEGELLLDQLAHHGIAGDVLGDLDSIEAGNAESRAVHLRVLTTLLAAILGENADRVFTEKDLRAIGVDPIPPDPNDYGF